MSHHVFDISNRGQLCFSRQDKRTLQTISFFDSGIDLARMNRDAVRINPREPLTLEQRGLYYTIEISNRITDISCLMLHRLEAGYKLDSIELNHALSNRFQNSKY